ncbi:MAG TPA: TRAM domain-containing protein [Propionibacteriaceae bacterium]|nr:TRAM domain-containing protein [Propionibacteriaceae bacterium]
MATPTDPHLRAAEPIGPVEVGPVAHGGHCVARHEGRVIFVRHTIPGETVMVRLTDTTHERFWRGDAVEILQPSPDRVTPVCPVAGPGQCGGCDFQHVSLQAQRDLKTAVVAEQLHRLAGINWPGAVEDVSTEETRDGLRWRTRMRYHVSSTGKVGLHAHRSQQVIPLPAEGCAIAGPDTVDVTTRSFPPGAELITASGSLAVDGRLVVGAPMVHERAAGRDWAVHVDGFWQTHPAAAGTLVDAVLSGLEPREGDSAFDLYCGVGLFTGALADRGCEVWAVEHSKAAVRAAHLNLTDVAKQVHLRAGRVERQLARMPARTDLVVLDPPRSGAGRAVLSEIAARRPRAITYVACDPAALARDLGTAAGLGYVATSIRAFDLFPMTHHIECVATLRPASKS